MAKFKLPSVKEWEEEKKKKEAELGTVETDEPKERFQVGGWLFENMEGNPHALTIVNIKRAQIEKNENNQYSIDGIPSLAESIKQYGLAQPLHVMEIGKDKYKLLGGERRLTAIDMLIADESVEDWTENSLIPCVVKGFDEVKLDLSDENKERYAILITNKEQRVYSDSDRYNEIQEWKKIIEELRAKGIEQIEQIDDEGNEVAVQIKGEKTRDILTKTTGLSRGQINKFETVHNQGSDKLIGAVEVGEMSINEAEKIAKKLTPEEQDKVIDSLSKGESVDVQEKEESSISLTPEMFKKDIKNIVAKLKNSPVVLSEKEQEKYHFYLKQLEKIIE